jgi:hypothetical protein
MPFLGALNGAIGIMGGSFFTTLFTGMGRFWFNFTSGKLLIESGNAIRDNCNPGVNLSVAVRA